MILFSFSFSIYSLHVHVRIIYSIYIYIQEIDFRVLMDYLDLSQMTQKCGFGLFSLLVFFFLRVDDLFVILHL